MRYLGANLALLLLLSPCAAWADQVSTDSADQLFQAGKFDEAGMQYATAVAQHPDDYHAILQLGRIALLGNRFDNAKALLQKASSLRPDEADPKVTLAEVYYRQDEFDKAAAALNGIDASTNQLLQSQYPTLNVAKLQSFAGQTPYQVQGGGSVNHVSFLQTDPLPLVSVRVNGGQEATFFIDTGGSEVALDADFAQELGVPNYGSVQGTFSGGQQARVSHTRIDSLALGSWTIQNLPAVMLPLRQLSELAGGRTINGLIGTTLIYHFLATLDYPHGELVLRKRNSPGTAAGVSVPFWMAGDHFMVGWGRVEDQPPSLLFVDTGLIGAGVKLGEAMLKNAGVALEYAKATTGAGAGGTLTTVPYVVHKLSFGQVQETDVPGLYDGPFPWENLFGFYLAGMVGHDFFRPYAMTFDFDHMQIHLMGRNVQPHD
jgi:predicted negative regulator of RcsB-dependent stress response